MAYLLHVIIQEKYIFKKDDRNYAAAEMKYKIQCQHESDTIVRYIGKLSYSIDRSYHIQQIF